MTTPKLSPRRGTPSPLFNETSHRWLMSLLVRRPELAQRLANAGRRLAELSRPRQSRLLRRLGLSLSSATLLLALAGSMLSQTAHAQVSTAATISVVNGEVAVVANGKCSLIEAINNANAKSGRPHADCVAGSKSSDTIQLPTNGSFVLNAVAHTSYYGYTGLPPVTSAIVVAGNGSTIARAAGDSVPEFRLFEVAAGSGDLTLQNLTLSNGYLESNYGGAVLTYGKLTVTNSTLTGNFAAGGGAVSGYRATINIQSSTLTDNTGYQTGGAVALTYGSLTVSNSTFDGNETVGGGGAIFTYSAPVTVSGSTFVDNSADYGGGASLQSGRLSITASNFTGNTAYTGGALYVGGYEATSLVLRETTIHGNSAESAAAIAVGNTTLTVDRTTISNNASASYDGAVNLYYSDATFSNSTISGNSGDTGAGIYADYGTTSLVNVTVSGNTAATAGGGILVKESGTLRLTRSIISGNSAPSGREISATGATVTANGFNLFGVSGNAGLAGFAAGATDRVAAGAIGTILQPLADNGGSTKTHALATNSPAIDVAPTTACNSAPVSKIDQRGLARGVNGNNAASANECDLGAFEAQPPSAITGFTPGTGSVGTTVTINGTNLTGATGVRFNTTAATSFSVKSATQITAVVPPGATTGKISVIMPGGTLVSESDFTVTAVTATITKFSPPKALVGKNVTIIGKNLADTTAVTINGVNATIKSKAATKVVVIVPAGATSGKIVVTTSGGQVEAPGVFTVIPAKPILTSIAPTSGPVGTWVTIIGTNLGSTSAVKFGSKTATEFEQVSETEIRARVPVGSKTGVLSVTTPGGTAKSKQKFTVTK